MMVVRFVAVDGTIGKIDASITRTPPPRSTTLSTVVFPRIARFGRLRTDSVRYAKLVFCRTPGHRGQRIRRHPMLFVSIEVVKPGKAMLVRSVDEHLKRRCQLRIRALPDGQRATTAVKLIIASRRVLQSTTGLQHLIKGALPQAVGGPIVEVARSRTQRGPRRSPPTCPQHLAARNVDHTIE